jgi:pimeloyl-ACP methyl ester carboxylesterase
MSVATPIEAQAVVRKVYNAFFTPNKYEVKMADEEVIARGDNFRIPFKDGELACTSWGKEGPVALLMHGWGGARAQMTGFVEPLLSAGYRVLAYDQPAHGESDGKFTNILEIAPTMDLMLERFGKFDAVIAHSFGTLIASYSIAMRNFPPPSRLVYFGSFNRLMDALPRFQTIAKLPDGIIEGLRLMIDEKHDGDLLAGIVNERLVQSIHAPALMFHDRADNVTPVEDSRAIANAWAEAQYIETSGLGHRGALQSPEVHEQMIRFLKG